MGKPRNKAIDLIQYLGLRLVSMGLHSFPVDANLRTARLLGDLMYLVDRKHRDRALGNLRRSFPNMPESQRKLMARRSMQQLFMLFIEVLFTTRLVRIDTWREYCELSNFQDVLQLLLKRKQGVIMLTGHYGNWEILGYVLATLGFHTTAIARPLDNVYVNRWLMGVRENRARRSSIKKARPTK